MPEDEPDSKRQRLEASTFVLIDEEEFIAQHPGPGQV
jgi:hypothetical protein